MLFTLTSVDSSGTIFLRQHAATGENVAELLIRNAIDLIESEKVMRILPQAAVYLTQGSEKETPTGQNGSFFLL